VMKRRRIAFFAMTIAGGLLVSQNIGHMLNNVESFYVMFEGLRSGRPLQPSFYTSVYVAVGVAVFFMALYWTGAKKDTEILADETLRKRLTLDN
jgi:hypothetical protein